VDSVLTTDLDVEALVARTIAGLNEAELRTRFAVQDEFLCLDSFLPAEILECWNAELEVLIPRIHRNYIPSHKKGGSVVFETVAALAPTIHAVYTSPTLLAFFRRLFAADVSLCPPTDPHRCVLYAYTEAGDHMGWHYDRSYYRGARYTVLFGLRDRSSSRLLCRLHTKNPGHEQEELAVRTAPGMLVAFNGAKLYHSVSPQVEGEHRFVVSMEYVTSPEMNWFLRFVSNMKDAIAYFGFKQVFFHRRKAAP